MNDTGYYTLREQIEGLLTESRLQARQAGEWEKVETYWQIGEALTAHIDAHPGSGYGQRIVRNLSKDLKLGYTTLYEILRFRRVVVDPKVYARTQLAWSHFRALIHLPSTEQIHHFAALAQQHSWTTRQLKQAIESGGTIAGYLDAGLPAPALRPRFGEPWTYRILVDRFRPDAPPAIDFGFHQVFVPAALPGFESVTPGDTITLETRNGQAHVSVRDDRPGLWTYIARVLRIVDGDTLDVVVDLGLGHRAFPRLRLRGIDTAELYTAAGRTAKEFVENALTESPIVLISTWRTDSYGRYLADVRYHRGADDATRILKQGTYLN